MRYEPVRCTNVKCGHLLDRSVVRQRVKEGKAFAFCNDCGEKLTLPTMAEPIQLTREVQAEVESQRRAAQQRTRFEQAVFRVHAYVTEQKITPPETFISYAWGVPEHERWVEKRLAMDLQKAGINVVLDRWHNAQIGANVVTAGVVAIFNSNAALACGADSAGASSCVGKIFRAQLANGIDGALAADFAADEATPNTVSFKGLSTGETWTLNGTAVIASDFQAEDTVTLPQS
jgi:hypothetical protein